MSSFFERELRHLFGDGKIISSPVCTGQACLGTLGKKRLPDRRWSI